MLLQILRSRWLSFLIAFSLVVAGVAAYTFTAPKVYTATASLVIDPKVDPIAGTVLAGMASPSYLMTQVDIIQSSRVAARVVSSLRLTEIAELREQWMARTKGTGDFAAYLADMLRGSLEVRPSRGSNVINLFYSGSDPRFVETVANAFIKAYLDTTLELRTSPAKDYSRFFDTNAKALRDSLEAAQAKLSAYQQKTGLVVSDERLDVETQRLNELNAQLVLVQAAAADTKSRDAQAQTQGDRMLDVMANPMVAGLRAELARQEAQLEQMSSRLGENHPAVRELKLGIADNRTRFESEVRRAQSSVGISNQVNQSRVAQARTALEEQRARVLKLRAVRDEASVLVRDVENSQRAYDGVLARLNMTNLESQTNQVNVAALERATAPNQPSSPRNGLNLMLGGLVGGIFGLLVVGTREARDRRVRGESDFEALLNQPLIGVVPSYKKTFSLRLGRGRSKTPLLGHNNSGRKPATT
ncbi:chain length determinant protein EpsF [Rubrivivax sp. A210]|uniref:chain length determinant protein EpsF n=1 Tax=Rubrivivax sp. A210 TaxID=2772301 RepID=UPI001F1913AA|nr:chain length determinant protein EpsF [Rubrivivax sp. A210]